MEQEFQEQAFYLESFRKGRRGQSGVSSSYDIYSKKLKAFRVQEYFGALGMGYYAWLVVQHSTSQLVTIGKRSHNNRIRLSVLYLSP